MPESYDVIVVGGGCNGTGIARDAAMRGLKVLLLEKNDFASGTTGASSGMIHGGPRYLMTDVKTTRTSSKDAGYIKKIASHLCFRIPFLYPVVQGNGSSLGKKIVLTLTDAFFDAYDRFSALKGGEKHTRLSREEALQLEPSLSPNVIGALTFDEWGINSHRLCVANALAAQESGGTVKNHNAVAQILKKDQTVHGVRARNLLTGEESEYHGKILVNATGPWATQFCAMAGVELKLRPAKGIHLVLDRRITNIAVVSQCIDGREIFINPHGTTTLLGTTDDDYYGDLDDIPVTPDEIEYLLQGMEKSYPEIRKARVISTTRGVRPTLYQEGIYEDDLSRGHRIFDHERENGLKGMISLAGGKLASYRQMAEETTNLLCKKLKVKSSCSTHWVPLPGGDKQEDPQELAKRFSIHPYAAERMIARHGSRAEKILESTETNPEEKLVACPCEPVTRAEIRYVIREEWALTLADIGRRTTLGEGPCQGTECLLAAVGILTEETGRDPIQEIQGFLAESWRRRRPLFESGGTVSTGLLAQEEILRHTYLGLLGVSSCRSR